MALLQVVQVQALAVLPDQQPKLLEVPRTPRQLGVQRQVARVLLLVLDPQPRLLQVPKTQRQQGETTIKAKVERTSRLVFLTQSVLSLFGSSFVPPVDIALTRLIYTPCCIVSPIFVRRALLVKRIVFISPTST